MTSGKEVPQSGHVAARHRVLGPKDCAAGGLDTSTQACVRAEGDVIKVHRSGDRNVGIIRAGITGIRMTARTLGREPQKEQKNEL